ncbi:hypothetical protein V2J09_018876 [Rumex salicifolius]
MGVSQTKLLLLLSNLAFLLASATATATAVLPPAAAPSYHHHHNPHPHPLHKPHPSPSYAPAKPPVHPPVKPPTKPPVYPPVKPPVHPPVKPPTKPPTYPPVHPPVKPPTKPPVHPPVKPPTKPPVKPLVRMRPVAVQGVVFCKNCSYSGIDTLLGSKPLSGASVVLKCRTIKAVVMKNATTDKNGYFFIEAPKGVISYKAIKYCHVYLSKPPAGATCSQITNINGGRQGGLLKPQETFAPLPYDLFNVGPFAFQSPKGHCHKTKTAAASSLSLEYYIVSLSALFHDFAPSLAMANWFKYTINKEA